MSLDDDTEGVTEPTFHDASPPSVSDEASLLARIGRAFPALVVHRSRIERCGGDHLLLIVNDEHAFRFPRAGVHDLRFEIAVLRRLRTRTPVAVPAYDHVGSGGAFAGYPFIQGEALTAERFGRLSRPGRTAVLDAVAAFLRSLHGLRQEEVGWSGAWPATWTAAQFADRGTDERLPVIARHVPRLAAPLRAFFRSYRHDRPERPAIIHGDLVGEHMLVDRAGNGLAGIIDFGDVALGDAAQDLLGLWAYGTDAVIHVIDRYDPSASDPGLLSRSRNHFIRYRVDQLFGYLAAGSTRAAALVAELEDLLVATQPTTGIF